MNKLLIDCTATYFSQLNTGIQRTVKKIIENKKYFNYFGEAVPIVQLSNHYCRIDKSKLLTSFTKVLHTTGRNLRNIIDSIFVRIFKLNQNKTNFSPSITNIKLAELNTDSWKTKSYKIIIYLSRFMLNRLFILAKFLDLLLNYDKIITINTNDILFLPDSFWDPTFSIKTLAKYKKRNIKIVLLLHDILPLTHENLFHENNVIAFKKSFYQIIQLCDAIICNSDFTKKEFMNLYREKYGYSFNRPVYTVKLGSDVKAKFNENDNFKENFKGSYYLVVGTIEPRKNHKYIIDTFHSLWHEGFDRKLIIIGRIGWKCQNIIERIKTSPFYQKYLFMYNNVDDSQLVSYYRNCKAVITASIAEGYGLPLVEAMYFRKPVFASDIPIYREVGGNYPIFFDINSIDSLKKKIIEFENHEDIFLNREIPKITTWQETAEQLSKIFKDLTEKWSLNG